MPNTRGNFHLCTNDQDFETGKSLIIEYVDELGIDLGYQNFEEEINALPLHYGKPHGALLLYKSLDDNLIGCVGIRHLEWNVCELKRLYVRKKYRGQGIGRKLLIEAIVKAKELGYKKMRLDTLSTMKAALSIYMQLKFKEISPYRYNPNPETIYLELDLILCNTNLSTF